MKRFRISAGIDYVSPEALLRYPLPLLPEKAVLVVVRGMILAHSFPIAITEKPVTINQDMKALIAGYKIDPAFLAWSLMGFSSHFIALTDESAHGTRKLETETLAQFPIPTPPLDEQYVITSYLDRETAKIDALVAKVETAIERLKEYRGALISTAVTGKIDLRGSTE